MTSFSIFLGFYLLFIFFIVVLGYLIQRFREGSYGGDEKNHIDVQSLSVIIPFRNEEHRIGELLETIKELNYHPREYVFVDDHSEDGSVELIAKLPMEIPHKIITMENGELGKKRAIRKAIEQINSDYILTIDADVLLSPDYFLHLARLKNADMYVLPATMVAKRWWQHLFEVDLVLVNALNAGLSGWARPILASGANLLFSKKAFEKFDHFETHRHMPSGDDIYLLRDFRRGRGRVYVHTDSRLAVKTETPQSLKEFMHQRLRWIAKTGDVKDYLSNFLAAFQGILTLSFVYFALRFAIEGEGMMVLLVYFSKSGIDLLAFLPFFNRSRRLSSWLFIPFYEVLFPIYSLVILAVMYFYKPTWKGRKLERNY